MDQNYAKLAFTQSVLDVQEAFGTKIKYAQVQSSGDRFELTRTEGYFIQNRDSIYLSSVGENGWPYMQHKGGPKGFLKIIDASTLGMADFSGNGQYITTGNFNSTSKAMLFLMDYPTQSRLKIWVETEVLSVKDNPDLVEKLVDKGHEASVQRLFVFHVKAYDWNCNDHITPRFTREEFEKLAK